MPYPKPRRNGGGVPGRHAFSLVLSLTVMAMLLILCVGAAALLSIELRVATASVSMARARMNAMVGARVALGELQRLMGPDQRVSAPAEILCDPNQTDPSQASYYSNATNGTVVHPRWVGVWNTGRTDGDQPPGDAGANEETKVIYRTGTGALKDSRYSTNVTGNQGKDAWTQNRAGTSMSRSSKRLLGWLVSGSEALPHNDSSSPTPFTAVDSTKDIVMLGTGTLGSLFKPTQTNTDMLGSRARLVPITDSTGSSATSVGNYAYWIADEGVKSRFNIRDKFETAGITPNSNSAANGGLIRLLVSQTGKVSTNATRSPISGAPTLPDINYSSSKEWDKVSSFDDLPLADNPSSPTSSQYQASAYAPYYYNDFSFTSAGVDCDVENGGLKKDLTFYLQNRGDIADYSGAIGSGVSAANALLPINPATRTTEPTLTPVFPTFGLVLDWWNNAASYSGTAGGTAGVPSRGPITYSLTYAQSTAMHSATPRAPIVISSPDLKTSAKSKAPLSPIVTQMTMHFKPVYEGDTTTGFQARCLYYPQIVLWNPYSVPITLASPTVDYLNNWAIWSNINTSYSYVSMRTCWSFKLPATTISPGQSVSFVVVEGTNLAGASTAQPAAAAVYNVSPPIQMKVGLPTTKSYLVDSFCATYDTVGSKIAGSTATPPVAVTSIGYCNSIYAPGTFDEKTLATEQVVLKDGGTTLSHLKLDAQNPKPSIMISGDRRYATKPLLAPWDVAAYLTPLSAEPASGSSANFDSLCYGFRLKRLDSSETSDPGAGGNAARGLTVNPFVDMNVRAARQGRTPYDAQDMLCPPSTTKSMPPPSPFAFNFQVCGQYLGGIWTTDFTASETMAGLDPASATKVAPFYRSSLGASAAKYPGALLYDVPFSDVGLMTLGQLDAAPLNQMSYGPSMPFGGSRIPLPGTSLTNQTALSTGDLNPMWNAIGIWGGSANTQEALREVSRIGASTTDICDLSYELNHTLWDTYRFSGISQNNTGWNIASGAWQNATLTSGNISQSLPSSRYESAGGFPANTGFFSNPAYKLYHASYTLLEKGAFNVNSTSRIAWISLLTSSRNLAVPTLSGNSTNASQTPFPRVIRPKGQAAVSGSGAFSENVWAGYRSLSDQEIQTLATKIVTEVKKRGPFLSLSDFVNRRLKTPSSGDYSNWTDRECDYLGTLEAAINTAGLNDTIGAQALMDRTSSDTFLANSAQMATQTAVKPQHRAKHRIAGTPGYLQQSDILRSVGNALTARSDTFTVRALGQSDGASAWVELVVQREPTPLVAGTGEILPVNPKAIGSASAYAGNQFFGRRMRIASTRWLDPQSI